MNNSLKLSAVLPATPEQLYRGWLNSKEHAAFTGAKARIQAKVGGRFTAHDGYISGRTIALEPYGRIVQSWRTSEFPADSPDSQLELRFDETKTGTRLTLMQSRIPPGQTAQYKSGWRDYYFAPMRVYFAKTAHSKTASSRTRKTSTANAMTKVAATRLRTKPAAKKFSR
jgi:activator of HSP90 ATPase